MPEQGTHIIHTFPRNEGEEIQLALRKYKGRYYIDLRLWFQNEKGTAFRPTRKGVFFSIDHLSDFQKAVDSLSKTASDWPKGMETDPDNKSRISHPSPVQEKF